MGVFWHDSTSSIYVVNVIKDVIKKCHACYISVLDLVIIQRPVSGKCHKFLFHPILQHAISCFYNTSQLSTFIAHTTVASRMLHHCYNHHCHPNLGTDTRSDMNIVELSVYQQSLKILQVEKLWKYHMISSW